MKKATCKKVLDYLMSTFYQDEKIVEACDLLLAKVDQIEQSSHSSLSGSEAETYPLTDEIRSSEFGFALYSDGACRGNPGPGAWGSMGQSSDGEVIFEASGVELGTTNNRMELQGAIEAIKALINHLDEVGIENPLPIVYSDSKYVVDGMEKWVQGWKSRGWKKADKKAPENVEQWKELDRLRDEFDNIQFRWVKGHAGHPQNERCDQLANIALDESGF